MNIRRALGTAVAAAALALAPSTALASTYGEPDGTLTVSDVTPVVGQAFEVYVDGDDSVQSITLGVTSVDVSPSSIEIDGVAGESLTKDADADGDATFTVALMVAGEYFIEAVDQDGNELSSATVVVETAAGAVDEDEDAGESTGQPTAGADEDADDSAAGGGTLPDTGAPTTGIAAGAAALLLAGGGMLLVARRRQAQLG